MGLGSGSVIDLTTIKFESEFESILNSSKADWHAKRCLQKPWVKYIEQEQDELVKSTECWASGQEIESTKKFPVCQYDESYLKEFLMLYLIAASSNSPDSYRRLIQGYSFPPFSGNGLPELLLFYVE